MKKYLILGFALLMLSAHLSAQNGVVGNLTAQSTDCTTTNACLEVDIPPGMGSATLKISGTMNVIAQFEVSADPLTVPIANAKWVAFSMNPSDGTASATSATESGSNLTLAWQQNVGAYKRIRLRISTYTSGTVAGAINLSTASAHSGGGGGGGNIGGIIAANQVAVGTAANTIGGSNLLTWVPATPAWTLMNTSPCALTPIDLFTICTEYSTTTASMELIGSDTLNPGLGEANFNITPAHGAGNVGTARATAMDLYEVDSGGGGIGFGLAGGQSGGFIWQGTESGLTPGEVEAGTNDIGDGHAGTEFRFIPDGGAILQLSTGSTTWDLAGNSVSTADSTANNVKAAVSTSVTPVLVASLPAASGTAYQWRTVSDSTTVTVEGQTCVGSGTAKAAAFSNGAVWKCF